MEYCIIDEEEVQLLINIAETGKTGDSKIRTIRKAVADGLVEDKVSSIRPFILTPKGCEKMADYMLAVSE